MPKPDLHVGFCTHHAATVAAQRWHYSGNIPVGKQLCVGAWEAGEFVGAVAFGMGSCAELSRRYGMRSREVCELTRIAMRAHESPVSRILKFALRLLREVNPGIRLVVSFADPSQGHHGGVYQAAGWAYTGDSASTVVFDVGGHRYHTRSLAGPSFGGTKPDSAIMARARAVRLAGKHRYVIAFDAEGRQRVAAMAQSYPKRAKQSIAAAAHQAEEGGEIPTRTLQESHAA